jgi:hypothetical protein
MPNRSRPRTIRALECQPGTEYNEETFLHLLAIEQARAQRSKHRIRLLLATLEQVPGKPVPIPQASAARLFEGLRLLLRDTDILGWYRQSHVAGAVLTAGAGAPGYETSDLIEQRIGEGLRQRLPSRTARNLRVRVTHQGPQRVAKR